ncbi:crotonase/enoyl-CoA hydratase family protein [Falsigemmobacter faecalis]|uniref:Crotonase/enoyl-CoA hydratase family protein n=1 Tax=Falsigemmobacter faecalis TaxID=2488730 RepID=A0A3P3DDQ1_9RHOB|nr:crotonase/enoyl-CoA hydratase family protein [Falsigemmobacter faecalis]RRH72413.1 crotonase/enoyl-CoA hydratase family protein [Falsigemmobacter faecalis]
MTLVTYDAAPDGIVTLTLNAPATRNAISDLPMIEAILGALSQAEADPQARVIILTGAGTAFSGGGNIKAMSPGQGLVGHEPGQTRRNYRAGIQRLPLAFEALELPVIAAVNGPAIGAGCDLACMCDIRVAGRSARFAESFVRLGIVPGDGGAWLLPRVVGFARASELALTGEMIDAETALSFGLVTHLVEDADLLPRARAIAAKIAANPPDAVRMTRRLLRQSCNTTLPAVLDMSAAMQAVAHASPDYLIALQKMLDGGGRK